MARNGLFFGKTTRPIPLFIAISLFWMSFANVSFFRVLLEDYPLNGDNIGFLATLIPGFIGFMVLVLTLLCHRHTTKPVLILLLLGSSFAAYFMDSYQIAIDYSMIKNALETDRREASDLFSLTLLAYVLFLGVLPAWWVYRLNIEFKPCKQELRSRLKAIAIIMAMAGMLFFGWNAAYSSFFREHKHIRLYFNPGNYTYAIGKFVGRSLKNDDTEVKPLGQDAAIPENDEHRELIIMVVGETARADHFSLNGYNKKTNPLLEKQDVVSFTHVTSCGTSTSVSVPCMFSHQTTDELNSSVRSEENALDVLNHAGVNILWRDNNSSSKGVADRVEYQNYRDATINTICDVECRDEGMLVGLQDYIDAHPEGDIMIVLHQMGNHGPAYYKRYPKPFEKFTPVCYTNELSDCSEEELNNTYDNAILYTDYFLNKTIELLKQNDDQFETAMFYMSDHGESLGENGLYLHGMPNFIAPEQQRHVASVVWIGKNFDEMSIEELRKKKDIPFTHDVVFHTLLGLMEVETDIHDEHMDLFK